MLTMSMIQQVVHIQQHTVRSRAHWWDNDHVHSSQTFHYITSQVHQNVNVTSAERKCMKYIRKY